MNMSHMVSHILTRCQHLLESFNFEMFNAAQYLNTKAYLVIRVSVRVRSRLLCRPQKFRIRVRGYP